MRIALCAGEASGDLLGAGLIESLKQRFPDAEFAGIGGPRMREAGLQCWHDAQELAVMGLSEVIAHLPRLLKLRKGFRQLSRAEGPKNRDLISQVKTHLIGHEHYKKKKKLGVRTAGGSQSSEKLVELFPLLHFRRTLPERSEKLVPVDRWAFLNAILVLE